MPDLIRLDLPRYTALMRALHAAGVEVLDVEVRRACQEACRVQSASEQDREWVRAAWRDLAI